MGCVFKITICPSSKYPPLVLLWEDTGPQLIKYDAYLGPRALTLKEGWGYCSLILEWLILVEYLRMSQPSNDFSRAHGSRTWKHKSWNKSKSVGDNDSDSPGNTHPPDLSCCFQATDVLDIRCVLEIRFRSHGSGQVWARGESSSSMGEKAPFPPKVAKDMRPVESESTYWLSGT